VRIAITGPTGQLGRDLMAAAQHAGHHAIPLGRDRIDLVVAADPGPGLAHVAGALDAAEADAGPGAGADPGPLDVLIHCAAWTRVDDAEGDPAGALALNAAAPAVLAAECARRGVRLVFVSTDYVFDGTDRRPYREDDPTGPINVYGRSKLEGERLVWATDPVDVRIVRTASLYGRGGRNFVETMIRKGREEGRLRVVDDIVMSPTATADLAPAILALLDADAPPGIYHLVNQGQASWCEFARAIVEEAGIEAVVEPVPATEFPTAARRPPYSVLDTGKARALGVAMRPWRAALREYIGAPSR
jgi:dTDP-4-dehydrorhamnose reductase